VDILSIYLCVLFSLFYRVRKFLVTLVRVTAPKTIRLASFQLTLYGNSEELGPVVVTLIAACLHCGINGVHSIGFH
jgi:hypothetical protein